MPASSPARWRCADTLRPLQALTAWELTIRERVLLFCGSPSASKTPSIVKLGSDLPFCPGSVVVLNPQLRVVQFHEFFDALAALCGLLPVRVGDRNFFVRDLFRIVIEIT